MSFTEAINLKDLTTHEAITDALYRGTSALDEKNLPLLQSALTSDVVFNIDDYEVVGFDNLKKMTLDKGVETTHLMTNIRIDVENDVAITAKITANSLAQHYLPGNGTTPGEKKFTRCAKHALLLVKDEGDNLWKVKEWSVKVTWNEGDMSIFQSSSS